MKTIFSLQQIESHIEIIQKAICPYLVPRFQALLFIYPKISNNNNDNVQD